MGTTALVNVGSAGGGRTLSSTMNNRGIIYISSFGGIALSGGTLNNLPGGVINLSSSGGFNSSGSTSLLNNSGLITIDSAKGEVGFGSTALLNTGTINVDSGSTLRFSLGGTNTFGNGAVFTGAGTVDLNTVTHTLAGTLTLAGGNVILSGGTITGAGNLQINSVLNWTAGTISGTGNANVAHGAALNFGTASSQRTLSRALNNDGVINIPTGVLFLNGGTLNNLSDGVVNLNGGSLGLNASSNSLINNAGLINVNIASFGTLGLPTLTSSGTINVQSGAASLSFGSFTYYGGATFTGPGTIDFSNGSHTVNGNITLAGANMRFNSGTFAGPGDINLTGALAWGGGTFGAGTFFAGTGSTASGVMNVADGAIVSLVTPSSTRGLSRVLNNSGTINFQSTASLTFSNGTLNNLADGVINISSIFPFFSGSGSLNLIRNSGTINVDVGTGSTNLGSTVFLQNSGTINALSGTLILGTGTQNAGAFITGAGPIELVGNSSSQTFNGPVTLSGPNFTLNGGTISGPGDMNLRGTLNWGSGSILGAGIIDVPAGSTLNVNSISFHTLGRVANIAGTINLSNATIGLLTSASLGVSNNAAVNILPGGVMNLSGSSVGSVFINSGGGSLGSLTNHGQININGATTTLSLGSFSGGFVNAGIINATNGTIVLGGGVHTTGALIKGNGFVELGGNFGTVTVADTLTLNGTNISLNSGTIVGAGNLAVNGVLNWGNGTLAGPGAINVAPGAALTTTFSLPNASRGLSRSISNAGTINLLNTTPISVQGPVSINNFPGAFMNIASPQPFSLSGPSGSLFTNAGTIRFTGLAGTYQFPFPLVDSGTISVSSDGLTFPFASLTFNGGAVVTGAGLVDISTTGSPGTIVNGTLTLAGTNVRLSSGTLSGPGNIDITGVLNWTAGAISGPGIITVKPGGALNIGTFANAHILSRTINNNGAIALSGTLLTSGGTVNNQSNGVITVGTGGIGSLSGVNRVTNAGTINVPNGTFNVDIPFSNTGTLIVGTPGGVGTQSFVSGVTITGIVQQVFGSTLLKGNWIVHQNSTLTFGISPANLNDNAANVLLNGPGSNFPDINPIAINTGTFAIDNGRTFTTSASYANSGVTRVGANCVLTITGQLINTGTVVVDATGIINFAPPGPGPVPNATTGNLAAIQSQLASGYNNGAWNGPGINSDFAAAIAASPTPNKTAVGYAAATALGIVGSGTFAGQQVLDTGIILRYTLYGDSNLDLSVNALDFNVVANNFGRTDGVWTDGDFNYDGQVNTLDFNLLAGNINAAVPTPAPTAPLGSLVPEPTAIIFLALSILPLRRRHYRT